MSEWGAHTRQGSARDAIDRLSGPIADEPSTASDESHAIDDEPIAAEE